MRHLSRCLNYSRGECTPYFQSVGRKCDSTSLDWTGMAGVRWGKTMTMTTLSCIGSTWWGRGLGKAASTWLQWKRVRCRQWRGLGCLQALKWKAIGKWIHEKSFILVFCKGFPLLEIVSKGMASIIGYYFSYY